MVQVDAIIFLICFSSLIRTYFEHLHVFYSFNVLSVTNFIMINKKRLFFAKHDHTVNEIFIDLVIQVSRQN